MGEWTVEYAPDSRLLTLNCDGMQWMANNEDGTHDVLRESLKGNVLLAGLGLGFDCMLCERSEAVSSYVVVEKSEEVKDLVWPHLSTEKGEVVTASILDFMKATGRSFDVVWFDIFPNDPCFYQNEVETLSTWAYSILNPGGTVLFWRSCPPLEL